MLRFARTAGVGGSVRALGSVAVGLQVEEVGIAGPPTSCDIRGAGWAEAGAAAKALRSNAIRVSMGQA